MASSLAKIYEVATVMKKLNLEEIGLFYNGIKTRLSNYDLNFG